MLLPVAKKVNAGQITSAPGPMPAAISATITAPKTVPNPVVAAAHERLQAAKQEVTGTGIAASRVHTSLEVEISPDHQAVRTTYHYVVD